MEDIFNTKYNEFCVDLLGTCPELKNAISKAQALSTEDRFELYKKEIFKNETRVQESTHTVLPGVTIPKSIWKALSKKTKEAINQYNSILDLCVVYSTGDTEGISQEWVDKMMGEWKTKMEGVDFNKMTEKFFEMFGQKSEGASSNSSNSPFPPLPEKFLKGQMAKLAEELVKEFDPKEFGFSEEDIEACEKNPAKAFEILVSVSTRNPTLIQNALQKIGKRLQQKVQNGQLRPQELAAEAEELMKEFQNNPAFVDILESFRSAFNFEDMDLSRKAGKEGSARLSLVKNRLKKKLEAKNKAKGNSVEPK